jgi:hypothetical protein
MVTVMKTAEGQALVTWEPREDDPRGWIARAAESGWLEDVLTVLGASVVERLGEESRMRQVTRSTVRMQQELERRTRHLAVVLRNAGLSWAELADVLYEDDTKRSTARRAYEAGLRQIGAPFPEGYELADDDRTEGAA